MVEVLTSHDVPRIVLKRCSIFACKNKISFRLHSVLECQYKTRSFATFIHVDFVSLDKFFKLDCATPFNFIFCRAFGYHDFSVLEYALMILRACV